MVRDQTEVEAEVGQTGFHEDDAFTAPRMACTEHPGMGRMTCADQKYRVRH